MSSHFHFAVVGENISYSKSADIFKAALSQMDLSASCDLLSIGPDRIEETLDRIRSGFYTGASITIPYKSAVIEYLDELDPTASGLKAVNSIFLKHDRLRGFNTDLDGFAYPLLHPPAVKQINRAVLFGNGGAARAVTCSLANLLGCKGISVVGRTNERLETLKNEISPLLSGCEMTVSTLDDLTRDQLHAADIVVNCTPLGGWNAKDESPFPAWFDWSMVQRYYDINYNTDNQLINKARQAGVESFDGSSMLVAQAIKSLKLWTSLDIPFDAVHNAVFPKE